jgi:hypothetical protein
MPPSRQASRLRPGILQHIGHGIVMPAIIKPVIGDIEERHVELTAGMVMTATALGNVGR